MLIVFNSVGPLYATVPVHLQQRIAMRFRECFTSRNIADNCFLSGKINKSMRKKNFYVANKWSFSIKLQK